MWPLLNTVPPSKKATWKSGASWLKGTNWGLHTLRLLNQLWAQKQLHKNVKKMCEICENRKNGKWVILWRYDKMFWSTKNGCTEFVDGGNVERQSENLKQRDVLPTYLDQCLTIFVKHIMSYFLPFGFEIQSIRYWKIFHFI